MGTDAQTANCNGGTRERLTADEIATIERMLPTHGTAAVAEQLGRSQWTVAKYGKRLGMTTWAGKLQTLSEEDLEDIRKHLPTKGVKWVADYIGCGATTIRASAVRLGISYRRRKANHEVDRLILRIARRGPVTVSELKTAGCREGSYGRAMRRLIRDGKIRQVRRGLYEKVG